MCGALEVSEEKLRLDVKSVLHEAHMDIAVVVNEWLLQANTSRAQYMMKVMNHKSVVDRLFVWLAMVSQGCHINVLHAGGVWTTRAMEMFVMTDPTIMYIL